MNVRQAAMNDVRWQAVQEIFSQTVDLPADQRRAAVLQLCAGDEVLYAEVMDLIEEDSREQPLLDSSPQAGLAGAALAVLDFGSLPTLIERQIGPYHLIDLLGEGGMGVVYLAERIDIGGKVAIKLLRDAWLSPMRRQRFHIEQLTLAQLNHPSIARIYDANTLEDGTPWFVMEYAEGLPLTEHCVNNASSVRDRLKLMRRVCAAVQYAHSHAIIHRDLKPSNILVNAAGEVKLLDFGIAKHIDSNEPSQPGRDQFTVTGLRLMTLAYAAPEQLAGGAVGLYTDVYALGVLLYELLTGKLPKRDLNAAATAPTSIEKPSAIVRRESPQVFSQLTRSEWTDLDVLVCKALEPEAPRRYSTADSLIRDIDAFLAGRPLEARPAEWSYTAARFIRRNRRTLVAVAAAVLILAATIVFYTVRVAQARNAALREAARTLRMQQFTESLFDGGDKEAGPSAELRAVDLLDRGRHEADSLSGEPDLQADMQSTLGGIYEKLGKLDRADPLLASALDERRRSPNRDSRKVAESMVALALLRKEQARLDDAEKLARDASNLLPANTPSSKAARGNALVALGTILEVRGKYDEAGAVLESALKLQPQNAEATTATAQNLEELANVHFYKGRYDQAEALNHQAFDIYRRLFGEEHPAVAQILNNLGAIATNRGNYVASEGYYRHALAITEAWYGSDHPETAANLTAIAQQLSYQKRDDEAQGLLERALAIQQHVKGGVSSTVGSTLNQLGILNFNRKRYDAARTYFTQAMDFWRQNLGDQHPFIAIAYSNIGSVCLDQNDLRCAETNYREAIRRQDAVARDSIHAVIVHMKLGRALLRQSRFAEAEKESSYAYQYLVKHVPADNRYLLGARQDLVAIYQGLRRPSDAARYRAELPPTTAKS